MQKYSIISQEGTQLYPFLLNSVEECLLKTEEVIENLKKYKDKAHLARLNKYLCAKFVEKESEFSKRFCDESLVYLQEQNRNLKSSSLNITRSYDSNIVSSKVDNYLNRQSSKSYGR